MPKLAKVADVVILTDRCTHEDVLIRAASHVGLYGREYSRLVDVLVGGQVGSEGKGQIASFLSREYELLVRVGGPNAGHTVYQEPEVILVTTAITRSEINAQITETASEFRSTLAKAGGIT